MNRCRTGCHWLLMVLIVLAVVELSSHAALYALEKRRSKYYHPAPFKLTKIARTNILAFINDEPSNTELHPILGWAPKPSETILSGGPNERRKTETFNAQRIRGNRTYSLAPGDGIARLAAFGNSFTLGSEVSDEECWAEVMNSRDERIEVLNFGVGGYGLDQAFLRYQTEGVLFNPNVVLICYMTENLARHVNVFRPFYSHFQNMPVSKPRFTVEADTLRLLDNPLTTPKEYEKLLKDERASLAMLGKHDYFYQRSCRPGRLDVFSSVRIMKLIRRTIYRRYSIGSLYKDGYYNTDSEAFEVTVKLIEKFYQTVRRDNSTPVVVIFPYKEDMTLYRMNRTKSYQPLLGQLKPHGLRFVDLMEAFDESARFREVSDFFHPETGGHYSPLGNEIVATYLLRYLRKENLLGS